MKNKIEESELNELKSAHIRYNEVRSAISEVSIAIHRLQSQQSELIKKIPDITDELSSIESKLKEKYNAKRVDLTSGTYE